MKVLCLYNNQACAAPLVSTAPCFEAHGIAMIVRQTGQSESAVLTAIERFGFHQARDSQPVDVLLLQEPPLSNALLEAAAGTPVILLERIDGAQIRAARSYLPQVAGVIKSYTFRNRQQYNELYDRAHVAILHEAGIRCEKPRHCDQRPQPQLCDGDLRKVRTGVTPFASIARDHCDGECNLDAARPIDVQFAGTVTYQDNEIETHRRLALEAAETWPGPSVARAGRGIPRPVYHDQIRQSKTVLCPWGWGEATVRDYEAMALGAVVIKPDSGHVEGWPDIYDPMVESYVPCKPDFSDAHEKIAHVRDCWDDYRPMRRRARMGVEAAWQAECIADKMARVIKELLA